MTDPKPFEWNAPAEMRPGVTMPECRFELVTFCEGDYERETTEADLAAALADRPDVVRWLCAALPTMKETCQMAEALSVALDGIAEQHVAALRYAQEPCAYCMSSDIQRDAAIGERDALQARVAELEKFREQWDHADGNTPGYNRQKARRYGDQANEYRIERDALQARMTELETRQSDYDGLEGCVGALTTERDALQARVAELESQVAEMLKDERYAAKDLDAAIEAQKRAEADRDRAIQVRDQRWQMHKQDQNARWSAESRLAEAMRVVDYAVRYEWPSVLLGREITKALAAFDAREKDSRKDSANEVAKRCEDSGSEDAAARKDAGTAEVLATTRSPDPGQTPPHAGSVDEGTGTQPLPPLHHLAGAGGAVPTGQVWVGETRPDPEVLARLAGPATPLKPLGHESVKPGDVLALTDLLNGICSWHTANPGRVEAERVAAAKRYHYACMWRLGGAEDKLAALESKVARVREAFPKFNPKRTDLLDRIRWDGGKELGEALADLIGEES